jgi:hypothetical protein
MSPTKSKDPSPSKRNLKTKTPAVEPKPRAQGTKRKSSKAAAGAELTAGTDAKTEAPVADSAPAGSDTQVMSPPAETTAVVSAAKAEPPAADAPATASAPKVISPAAVEEKTTGEPIVQTPPEPRMAQAAALPVVMPSEPETPAMSNAKPAEKPLDFPKGALIAYRKSGGLKFSSREIVVYPDGRVTYDGGDTAKSALTRAARRLSDAQVMRLRRTLEQVNFFGMKPPQGQQDPDSFVIEIAARLGGKNNQIEVSAGDMPGALSALTEQLEKLLPSEE